MNKGSKYNSTIAQSSESEEREGGEHFGVSVSEYVESVASSEKTLAERLHIGRPVF